MMSLAKAFPSENEFGEIETNDVVIRGYTSIGFVEGYGKAEVEAREAVIPDRKHVVYVVRINLETADDFPQTAVAVISYDHVDNFLRALGQLERTTITRDRFAFSEVEYDVDGLKIVVFNDARGKLMFVITVGTVSVHFPAMSSLTTFKGLVSKAKEYLEKRRLEFA